MNREPGQEVLGECNELRKLTPNEATGQRVLSKM